MSDLLTPKQAAKMLGVSQSSVRRWCDAGLVATTKTTGGHRRIRRQALLHFARGRGFEMSDIAPIHTLGQGGRLPNAPVLSAHFYEHLLHEDEKQVQQFALRVIEQTGDSAKLCDDIIAPAMHQVGEEWSSNRLPIFREHAATQRANAAIVSARSQLSSLADDAPVAVCAALSNDPYSLAPAMCGLVLSASGFRVTLLGPNTPASEILHAAIELSAAVIAVSVGITPSSSDELAKLCQKANQLDIRVALGGRMLTPELRKKLTPDFFGDSMEHLSSYARRLAQSLSARAAEANGA